MPLIETRGAGSAQGFGEFAQSAAPVYIEDVFSTYLYTGNGAARSITNGIDLSGKGGLVWTKSRSNTADHSLTDTATGANKQLITNATLAQQSYANELTAFNSNGYNLGNNSSYGATNVNNWTYASWTFRKQKKFFDVVTYTGDGNTSKTIPHNLGSVPGCIITKMTSGVNNWQTYHRSLGNTQAVQLNLTNAASTNTGFWNNTSPTATDFTVGTVENASGETYVAYLFAHDAGGFGLSGSDNVISCGSFTGAAGSGDATINLGYEPQWILWKRTDSSTDGWWAIQDTFRRWTMSSGAPLFPNTSAAESSSLASGYFWIGPTSSTTLNFSSGSGAATYIYIAIRRGPMKVPTSGTSVFTPIAKTGDGSTTTVTNVGFPTDLFMFKWTASAYGWKQQDRLRGFEQQLSSDQTGGESNSGTYTFGTVNNTGYTYGANASTSGELNGSGVTSSVLAFRRAPGFFDVVCYTGNGIAGTTITHNLGVVPELVIVKKRSSTGPWNTLYQPLMRVLMLNASNEFKSASLTKFFFGNDSADVSPTSSTFTVASDAEINQNSATFVSYLFATVAGVSKVGSYTGTGSALQIDCGFTGGARFVLLKRTDASGSWYVYDSARGIVAGNDPYLLLNSTAAEVTNTDYVDTYSAGFELSSTAPAALNANGGTYIFLAIA